MGTGKSSVGKALGRRLGREVVDVDRLVEERDGRKIREIFEKDGEERFRRLEREAVRDAAAKEGVIITTGGGAVLDPENVKALRETGRLIALTATPETVYRRVKDSKHRPLLSRSKDVLGEIRRLLDEREPFYRGADYRFETDGLSPAQVAGKILKVLNEKGEPA